MTHSHACILVICVGLRVCGVGLWAVLLSFNVFVCSFRRDVCFFCVIFPQPRESPRFASINTCGFRARRKFACLINTYYERYKPTQQINELEYEHVTNENDSFYHFLFRASFLFFPDSYGTTHRHFRGLRLGQRYVCQSCQWLD
jgi:hypothetical protein